MKSQFLALLRPCALVSEEALTPAPPEAPFVLYTCQSQPIVWRSAIRPCPLMPPSPVA